MIKTVLQKKAKKSKKLVCLYTEGSLKQGNPECLYSIDSSNFIKYISFEIKLSLYDKAA